MANQKRNEIRILYMKRSLLIIPMPEENPLTLLF